MRKWLLIIAVLALSLLIWIAISQITEETTLTAAQVETRVATLYDAEIEHSLKRGDQYFVTFTKNNSTYEVAVNETDGGFSALSLLVERTTEEPPLTEPNVQPEPKPTTTPTITLTEQQAINAALAKFSGKVEDVDFEQTTDGGYYLVEIETNVEDEVTVQIHAITGKVMSFTFDD